jgi:hypothetical protein
LFFPLALCPESLCVGWEFWSVSSILSLVCSLPILKDLDVDCRLTWGDDDSATFQPSASPPLTGTLKLCLTRGMGSFIDRLLELPNGVHFQKIECSRELGGHSWYTADVMADVVKGCSNTLECVDLNCENLSKSHPFGCPCGW